MQYKFRGKSKETNQWVFGNLVYVADGDKQAPCIVISYGPHQFDWIDVIPETVGMWTGEYDKNNKEIYYEMKMRGRFATGLGGKSTRYKDMEFILSEHIGNHRYNYEVIGGYGDYRFFPNIKHCEIIHD